MRHRWAFPPAEARVFADFGHNLNWDRPGEVGTVLARFFAGRPNQQAVR
jgi:hypothetical protein